MYELLDMKLSFRVWALLGLAQGLCGAIVLGLLGAVWGVTQGDWVSVLAAPLLVPGSALVSVTVAMAGFPIYNWFVKQRVGAIESISQSKAVDGNA